MPDFEQTEKTWRLVDDRFKKPGGSYVKFIVVYDDMDRVIGGRLELGGVGSIRMTGPELRSMYRILEEEVGMA